MTKLEKKMYGYDKQFDMDKYACYKWINKTEYISIEDYPIDGNYIGKTYFDELTPKKTGPPWRVGRDESKRFYQNGAYKIYFKI